MATRNFLELHMNFMRRAATPGRAMLRVRWRQGKCVVTDQPSQHPTQQVT